jgi:HAD superfamily hydrolase (TIGR01509 family)
MGIIFDLDQTLLDSEIAEMHRKSGNWRIVYSLIPRFHCYGGLLEELIKLRAKGVKMAIVTNSPRIYTEKVISYFQIPCDTYVCYHDTIRRKPFPDPFLLAKGKLGLSNDRIYSFGDRAADIIGSKRAGLYSCACYWGSNEKVQLKSSAADYNFYTVEDAIFFLRNL